MPNPAAVGGAQLAYGVYSDRQAAKAAKDANRVAGNASAAELRFAQQQYNDWKAVFGPIEENLGEYYRNLTGDHIASRMLEQHEMQYNDALNDMRENLAQREITDDGIILALENSAALKRAKDRAAIRAGADDLARQQQKEFLQIGAQTNPANQVSNALGNQRADANYVRNVTAKNAGISRENLASDVFKFAGDYVAGEFDSPTTSAVPQVASTADRTLYENIQSVPNTPEYMENDRGVMLS